MLLTKQTWGRELKEGTLKETYVYSFFTNGTYRTCVQNDFGMRASKGTWRLSRGTDGKVTLHLDNPEADYYCIWRESRIRYDKQRDVLLMSGGRFGGEHELRQMEVSKPQPPGRAPGQPHSWGTARAVPGCKTLLRSQRR